MDALSTEQEERLARIIAREVVNQLTEYRPCKFCKGLIPHGAIICKHCNRTDP